MGPCPGGAGPGRREAAAPFEGPGRGSAQHRGPRRWAPSYGPGDRPRTGGLPVGGPGTERVHGVASGGRWTRAWSTLRLEAGICS